MSNDDTNVLTITIITPSFNHGRFIEDTIKSVLSQQGDFYLDYIVIDGASSDNTVDILKEYDSLLNDHHWPVRCRGIRFRWVSENDRGQTEAIAKGFALAHGDIYAWLNSDDIYVDGTLDRIVCLFRDRTGIDVIYGKGAYLSEDGSPVGWYPTEPFDRDRLAVVNFICQPSAFFLRPAYERCGGVNIALHYAMDYDLWIRMAFGGNFSFLPENLSGFRLHADSKTVSPKHSLKNHQECVEAVYRHYGRVPLNRILAYAFQLTKSFSSRRNDVNSRIIWLFSLPVAIALYFRFNKWIRMSDVSMITASNFKKLCDFNRNQL